MNIFMIKFIVCLQNMSKVDHLHPNNQISFTVATFPLSTPLVFTFIRKAAEHLQIVCPGVGPVDEGLGVVDQQDGAVPEPVEALLGEPALDDLHLPPETL